MHFKNNRFQLFLLILPFLIFIRLLLPNGPGFNDYDACRNFMIGNEMIDGNFTSLFHHASPLFNLVYALFIKISSSLWFLFAIGSILQSFGIYFLVEAFYKNDQISRSKFLMVMLVLGSSPYLINISHYVAMPCLTLFMFGLTVKVMLNANNRMLHYLLAGALVCVNYKAAFIFPLILYYDFVSQKKSINLKSVTIVGGMSAVVPILMILIGLATGHGLLKFPAAFYQVVSGVNANPLYPDPTSHIDFSFYPMFLILNEMPALLISVLVPLSITFSLSGFKLSGNQKTFLYFSVLVILVMILMPKAPRGLLLVLPILYLIGMEAGLFRINKKKIQYLIAGLLIIGNGAVYYYYYFNYTSDNDYRQLATEVNESDYSLVASTAGLNTAPYLDKDVKVDVVFSFDDLNAKNYEALIVDPMALVVGCDTFHNHYADQLRPMKKSSILENQILYLEHAEFMRKGYFESLNNYYGYKQRKGQIGIIRLR